MKLCKNSKTGVTKPFRLHLYIFFPIIFGFKNFIMYSSIYYTFSLAVMHTYIDPILYFLSSSSLFSRKINKISRGQYTFSSFSDFHRKSDSKRKSLICTLWIKKWVDQLVLKSDFLSKTKSRIWMILNFTKNISVAWIWL